jgi:protein-disulfide isomerase
MKAEQVVTRLTMKNISRNKLSLLLVLVLALAAGVCATAADSVNAVLRPPKGAQVAIVVFEDLQCPQCRRVAPILAQAAKTYKIPLVRHDFPLPMHNWSYEAAVMARYFDATSKELGNQFRDYIFSNQLEINPQNLRGYADKFAGEHKVGLPFVIDPQGKFAAEVNADRDIGKSINLDHTPTIYIVSDRHPEKPYVEVEPRQIDQQLYSLIDAMMKN